MLSVFVLFFFTQTNAYGRSESLVPFADSLYETIINDAEQSILMLSCNNILYDTVSNDAIEQSRSYFSDFLFPGNNGRMFSGYGPRWGRMHYGNDIKMNTGDTVVAVQSGTVIRSSWGRGFGYILVIQHKNNIQTYYAHLSKFLKRKGSHVKKGEAVALAGSTGNARGAHLHFEMRQNGRPFDPELVYDYKNRRIRTEAVGEESLIALHRKLKPQGYGSKRAIPEYYKVRSGDSLWVVSRRFKTSIKTICRLNRISENSILRIGQPLKLY